MDLKRYKNYRHVCNEEINIGDYKYMEVNAY